MIKLARKCLYLLAMRYLNSDAAQSMTKDWKQMVLWQNAGISDLIQIQEYI